MKHEVIIGDCRDLLHTFPDNSIHCCVTSPPYYGLRDYGVDEQIGLEKTPEEYVNELVKVFREVKRVLRRDGTLWLNLGDSYAGSNKGKMGNGSLVGGQKQHTNKGTMIGNIAKTGTPKGLKPKDLIGIPWRVAFALQADGWYLRQDIIWSKNNPMPESVTDRCTKSHEYIFLFSKSPKYFYDNDSIREPAQDRPFDKSKKIERDRTGMIMGNAHNYAPGASGYGHHPNGRNKRSVWQINTKPYKGAHFATFPPALVEPCVKAGSPVNGVVLDPFAGSGTVGEVCNYLNRKAILIELNPEYKPLILERASQSLTGFEEVV